MAENTHKYKIIGGVIASLLAITTGVMVWWAYDQSQQPPAVEPAYTAVSYTGETGYTALELLAARHTVTTVEKDGYEQVSTIDEQTADRSRAWICYVDSQPIDDPASYQTTNGQKIEWKLSLRYNGD
jgi:hypothetical protein